jgi:hypothetical protein
MLGAGHSRARDKEASASSLLRTPWRGSRPPARHPSVSGPQIPDLYNGFQIPLRKTFQLCDLLESENSNVPSRPGPVAVTMIMADVLELCPLSWNLGHRPRPQALASVSAPSRALHAPEPSAVMETMGTCDFQWGGHELWAEPQKHHGWDGGSLFSILFVSN